MANWYGSARSNYFNVKHPQVFKAFFDAFLPDVVVDIEEHGKHAGKVCLLAGRDSDSGGWPSFVCDVEVDLVSTARAWSKLSVVPVAQAKAEPTEDCADIDDDGEEEDDLDQEVDLARLVSPFLVEGEVVVLMEAGAEKLRYITGRASAFDHTGEEIWISLDQIYDLARKKFGSEPTRAEY